MYNGEFDSGTGRDKMMALEEVAPVAKGMTALFIDKWLLVES